MTQKNKRLLFAILLYSLYLFVSFTDNDSNTPTAVFGMRNRLLDQLLSIGLFGWFAIYLLSMVMFMIFPDKTKND